MLCGPLVAGCGAATRVDFAPHSRPASPLAVSVVADGDKRLLVDPRRISPGPVLFNVLNLSSRDVRFSVSAHGRLLARSPAIAPQATAQIEAIVSRGATIADSSRASLSATAVSFALDVSGRARTGDDALLQP